MARAQLANTFIDFVVQEEIDRCLKDGTRKHLLSLDRIRDAIGLPEDRRIQDQLRLYQIAEQRRK